MEISQSFNILSAEELLTFAELSSTCEFHDKQTIFTEGDESNAMYVIKSGRVLITIDKSGKQVPVAVLEVGSILGEMGLVNSDTRNATAMAEGDVTLLCIDKQAFTSLLEKEHELVTKIHSLVQARNDELLLKEQLIATTGVGHDNLHVSIKGDPSLRETAFTRERYENVVDSVLPGLVPALRKLLFDTSVYRIFIGLNNGEVRISSVINPFIEELHTAKKIVSQAYIGRHFPPMDYETKVKFIHEVTEYIESTRVFAQLPPAWNRVLDLIQDDWKPVPREELEAVLERLLDLRKIPNFYLRNLSISVAQDAIRMQFNCDGTHIVSTGEYERFLEENIEFEA